MDKDEEQDVSELLDAIVWGHRIVEVSDKAGNEQSFVLRPLTLEERNMGNYVYKQTIKREQRLSTRKQLTKNAIDNDLWKASYEKEAKLLREELVKITNELDELEEANKKRRSPTTPLKRLRKRFVYLQDTLKEIDSNYIRYIELPSIEYHAECERGNYFLHCSACSFPDMKQVWSTLQNLKDETNTTLVALLLNAYYNEVIADEATIRRVARAGIWRCKWMGAKKNRGVKTLFNREMYDLTADQFRLMYWSQIYDSAYESMEPPSDSVINDDKLFDRWLDEQHQKRKQEQKKSAFNKKVSHLTKDSDEVGFNVQGKFCEECSCGIKEQAEARGSDKRGHLHDPSCSYGVYLYYNQKTKIEKVEEVQSANSEMTRKVLAGEQKRLAKIGVDGIEEQYLRGDKTRTALGLSTTTHGAGEYSKGKRGRA